MKFDVERFLLGLAAGACFGLAILRMFAFYPNIVTIGYLVLLGVGLTLYLSKKTSVRELSFFVCAGLTAVFLIYVFSTSLTYFNSPYLDGGYSSWAFHKCYSETLDAGYCSESVIQVVQGQEEMGYSYYPPFIHFAARLIPFPVLMLLVFIGVAVVLTLGSKSFFAAPLVFFLAPNVWFSFIRGGTLPFFFALFIALVLTVYWKSLTWVVRGALIAVALLSHVYGGWFVAGIAILFALLEKTGVYWDRAKLVFFISLFSAFYFTGFLGDSIRVFLIPLLFAGLLLDEAL